MKHTLTSLKNAENMPAGFNRSSQIAKIISSLTPVQMRDIILDNRESFPELSEMSESEITKNLMIESYNIRNKKSNKKAINFNFFITGLIVSILIILAIVIITGDFNTQILPAVAGYPY